tara:strand:- start:3 stop:782 length:780 start_codon:yes stop_codon:yes gene_type:complete
MQIISQPQDLPQDGCAFVPTMGALHAGHCSLIKKAAEYDLPVVVSVFINPEQFAPNEDFHNYPKNLAKDVELASEHGADIVFAPTNEIVYPHKLKDIVLPPVATMPRLEDAFRPTHFQGVCKVVSRLFDLVQPIKAIFGEKDYQQLLVIKAMAEKTGRWKNLEIIGSPIVRSQEGLALSSRNCFLSQQQRKIAHCLHKAIACDTEEAMLKLLKNQNLTIDYAVIRNANDLLQPNKHQKNRALVAVKIGNIRLIDNGEIA